jgi:hypothetical protein
VNPTSAFAGDIAAIVQVSYRYAAGIDHRDWELYRAVFTDVCEFDFSSWSGAPAAVMPTDDWVAAARKVNGNFDATQHVMSNHLVEFVDNDTAIGTNEVQAQHWFSAPTMSGFGRPAKSAWCLLGGHFKNRYVRDGAGWRISYCQLTVRWRMGDERIFALARDR